MKISAALAAPSLKPIVIAASLLCLYGLALPMRTPQATGGASIIGCLTEADRPRETSPIPELERCSALLPSDADLVAALGDAYEAAGRSEEAETAYRRALMIDPEFADVRRSLAGLLARRGAVDEARRQLETALRVQPNRRELVERLHP